MNKPSDGLIAVKVKYVYITMQMGEKINYDLPIYFIIIFFFAGMKQTCLEIESLLWLMDSYVVVEVLCFSKAG